MGRAAVGHTLSIQRLPELSLGNLSLVGRQMCILIKLGL
jgi:hypothetical protein